METTIESLIDLYLTRCGRVFTATQFEAIFNRETGEGGSSPDIIALDFGRLPKEVVVVEITVSANLSTLHGKIEDRERRWYRPLRHQLTESGVIDDSWEMRTLVFVREPNVTRSRTKFAGQDDVAFFPIEKAILPYDYWEERMSTGLPR